MADNSHATNPDVRELPQTTIEALTSTNFAAETITPDASCVIRSVYWQKPADCDLEITLETAPSGSPVGAAVLLVDNSSATTGAAGAGRVIPRGGRISVTTTKATAGTVRVTLVTSPANVGV